MGQGKKLLKRNVVPKFEDLKKPAENYENHCFRKVGSLRRNK